MAIAQSRQVVNGWNAVGIGVVTGATLAVLGAVFWFADWRANVNNRFDNMEFRMETRFNDLETRMGNLETRMDNLEVEIGNLRALIIERLPVK